MKVHLPEWLWHSQKTESVLQLGEFYYATKERIWYADLARHDGEPDIQMVIHSGAEKLPFDLVDWYATFLTRWTEAKVTCMDALYEFFLTHTPNPNQTRPLSTPDFTGRMDYPRHLDLPSRERFEVLSYLTGIHLYPDVTPAGYSLANASVELYFWIPLGIMHDEWVQVSWVNGLPSSVTFAPSVKRVRDVS